MDVNGTAWEDRPGGFCKCRAVKILVLFLSASYNKRKEDDMEKGKRILLTLLFVILAAHGDSWPGPFWQARLKAAAGSGQRRERNSPGVPRAIRGADSPGQRLDRK